MILLWSTIVALDIPVLAVAPVIAQPAPFLISCWIDYSSTVPVNNLDVTVTNLNTSEVFTPWTTTGSSYYQVETSSYNVSTGNILHFHAGNGAGTELNRTAIHDAIDRGGFVQNPIPITPSQRICGDVNDDGTVNLNMTEMTLWYDYADYPTPGAYEVNCC